MIDKVVGSIIEAENEAKRMVEEAERAASELLSETDVAIERSNAQATSENKSRVAARLKDAKEQSEREARVYFEGKSREIEAEVKAHSKNLNAAIKIISEKI